MEGIEEEEELLRLKVVGSPIELMGETISSESGSCARCEIRRTLLLLLSGRKSCDSGCCCALRLYRDARRTWTRLLGEEEGAPVDREEVEEGSIHLFHRVVVDGGATVDAGE